MNFPGGSTTIPKPTRAALILSAKQWVTAAREAASEETPNARVGGSRQNLDYVIKCCERVELILKELAEMEK